MNSPQAFAGKLRSLVGVKAAAIIASLAAAILVVAGAAAAQEPAQGPAAGAPNPPWLQKILSNPALLNEFGVLMTKIQKGMQYPPPRNESRILPLLPDSTEGYAALPNYGEPAHQVLTIFREELRESAALRAWYEQPDVNSIGSKVESFLDKTYQLSQYLGDEAVVSGSPSDHGPSVLVVAEIRKPGLRKFLEQTIQELAAPSAPPAGLVIMEPKDLAAAKDPAPSQSALVLVRPDFLVVAFDIATLRSFNAQLGRTDRGGRGFASTPFGRRVAQAYQGGISMAVAADMHQILAQIPQAPPDVRAALERSGFADMKYLVGVQRTVAGQRTSEMELSFIGPRKGVAAWLAKPLPLGSLDFVSPKAIAAISIVLANPPQIFDDAKLLSSNSPTNAFAGLAQFEQALNISVRDDILSRLTGEITVELDDIAPGAPVWKAMLRVKDADGLQQIFQRLLVMAPLKMEQSDEPFKSYTLRPASGHSPLQASYAFVDGYLVVASSHETLVEAVRLHRSGESLAKNAKFQASLPAGHASGLSALIYEDPTTAAKLSMGQAMPQLAAVMPGAAADNPHIVLCAYGDDSAIRGASTNPGLGFGAVMVGAAIAIPNLLRSRIAANEASAVASLRAVNTAQLTYSITYPDKGFARALSNLGPGTQSGGTESPEHAGILDAKLAGASCTAGAWCEKSGYRFRLTATCQAKSCDDYVVTATPVDANTGGRSFCSTSDGVIRYKSGEPLRVPLNVAKCQAWPPTL
jgi:hypothetical protein